MASSDIVREHSFETYSSSSRSYTGPGLVCRQQEEPIDNLRGFWQLRPKVSGSFVNHLLAKVLDRDFSLTSI
jgi:hypothetical protein